MTAPLKQSVRPSIVPSQPLSKSTSDTSSAMPSPGYQQQPPLAAASSPPYSTPISAYPSMKQFTFPITPTTHTAAASSNSSRPPSSQRSRATTPVRPSLSHAAFPARSSTAAAAAGSTLASELDGVNARVDRKFAYWKSYWATVQQHAAATAAETVTTEQQQQQHEEEKQQTSTAAAAAGAKSREQLEAVIRRMRETREEEMATSKLNTPRDTAVADKAKTAAVAGDKRAEMHDRRWDASPRLHKTDAERKRSERRRTSEHDTKAGADQSPKSAAELRTERVRALHKSSASPPPSSASRHSSLHSPSPSSHTSSTTTNTNSSSSSSSNLHRFWQDELHRQPHTHHPAQPPSHSTAQRGRRRKMEHLTLPADPEQARRLWEKMKLEMWQQWEEYQRNEDVRSGGRASRAATGGGGGKVRVEEEKEPVDQPLPSPSPSSASSFTSAFSSATPFARASSHYVPPSSSSSGVRETSGRRSTEPGPLPGSFSEWSVRELRAELLRLNLTTHDCLEKSDMVDKLTHYHRQHQQQHQQQQQQRQERHSSTPPPQLPSPVVAAVVDADHIIADVQRWSYNKSIIQLLNDLNVDHSHTTTTTTSTTSTVLQYDSSVEEVSRVYKKTLLRVHPDKCGMLDEEKRLRATEVFKVIHDRFVQFRERHDKRGTVV